MAEKLRIAILYDTWGEEEVEVQPAPKRRSRKRTPRRREKEDREEIFEALEKLGHEPFYQVLDGTKQSLFSLSRCGEKLVFNLTESYAGDDTMDMNIAAYMDLIGMPYTGTGPRGLFLGQEKSVAKKLF